ncbi:unnamed protein product [Brassica oleracea]
MRFGEREQKVEIHGETLAFLLIKSFRLLSDLVLVLPNWLR